MGRMLHCAVRVDGKDFENFGSDEFIHTTQMVDLVLNDGDDARPLPVGPFRWGGECRVEVHLEAIANDKGTVNMFGFTSFFEGSSEDTPDERDREVLNFLVPKTTQANPNPTVVAAHMQSGDDFADVVLTITNGFLEEE